MRYVLYDTEILEHPSLTSQCGECHESSQRAGSPFLAWLGRLCTPVPRLRPRWQERCALGTSRFETPLDILAREHPDIHLRVMSGMGQGASDATLSVLIWAWAHLHPFSCAHYRSHQDKMVLVDDEGLKLEVLIRGNTVTLQRPSQDLLYLITQSDQEPKVSETGVESVQWLRVLTRQLPEVVSC